MRIHHLVDIHDLLGELLLTGRFSIPAADSVARLTFVNVIHKFLAYIIN